MTGTLGGATNGFLTGSGGCKHGLEEGRLTGGIAAKTLKTPPEMSSAIWLCHLKLPSF